MSKWERVNLDEVCREITVGHVGPMANEYVENGIPFLRSLNVEPFSIRRDGLKYITPIFHEKLRKSALKPGDVVIVRTGKPGACAVIPDWLEDANCSDLVVIRCGPRLRPRFLCYVVNSVAGQHIDNHLVGAVQQHFNVGSARTLKLSLPSIDEQDQILELLCSLDDKIDCNRRMNETLEAMARAMFKDWFVDFGPTRAKMEGRAPYLDPEIWDLFPDRLDDEGKPEGWGASTIGRETRVLGGATPSTKEPAYWEGGTHHWATPKDLSGLASPVLISTDRKITNEGVAKISSGLLPVGTVLLSSRAPVGYLAITEIETAINQGFIAMNCEGRLSNIYILLWCYQSMEHIKAISGGSTFAEISKKTFRPLPVVIPSQAILQRFDEITQSLYQRIVCNTKGQSTLGLTRDLLLPKLMSGEIRVKGAEKAVGDVL